MGLHDPVLSPHLCLLEVEPASAQSNVDRRDELAPGRQPAGRRGDDEPQLRAVQPVQVRQQDRAQLQVRVRQAQQNGLANIWTMVFGGIQERGKKC